MVLGQPGRAGSVGMWLVGPVGGRFWSGYLWMGCFCWLHQNFWFSEDFAVFSAATFHIREAARANSGTLCSDLS